VKLLIFIEHNEYVRNYFTTGAFDELKGHQINYVISKNVTMQNFLKDTNATLYKLNFILPTFSYVLANQLQMCHKSERNKNFIFRLRRELIQNIYSLFVVPNPFYVSQLNPIRMKLENTFIRFKSIKKFALFFLGFLKVAKNVFSEIRGLVRYIFINTIVKLRLNQVVVNYFWSYLPLNKIAASVIFKDKPDLLIIPNSVVGVESYELMRACYRSGFTKVLLLIDNWDNLSSKSAFIKNPDYLGVWGQQSAEFATCFHDIPAENVRVIGTPRFGVYQDYKKALLDTIYTEDNLLINQPYILFAGCAVGFDEIGALKSVAASLRLIRDKLPSNTVILYRPHPWGNKSGYLKELQNNPIDGVIIDPQILMDKDLLGSKSQPSLNYYPQLLDKALFIICPLSTMIIESTIMSKNVLALAHEDSISLFSPNRILANYKHFEGVNKLRNITILSALDDLPMHMISAYSSDFDEDVKKELNFFVSIDTNQNYSSKLADYVSDIESKLMLS
jgi:hypothetical protein